MDQGGMMNRLSTDRSFLADNGDIFHSCATSVPSKEQDAANHHAEYVFVNGEDAVKGS